MIKNFAPASLHLGLTAWLFVPLTGVPLGVLPAVKRGTIWDLIGWSFAVFGQAPPPFWLGIMLILLFVVKLDRLPLRRRCGPSHYILPAATPGWLASAGLMRMVRHAMLEVLDSEYIKLVRGKGGGTTAVIRKHALRDALIPPLTFGVLIVAAFIAGPAVTETVFAWPGPGLMTVSPIINIGFPVINAAVMVFTIIQLLVVFLVDVLYACIGPRIKLG